MKEIIMDEQESHNLNKLEAKVDKCVENLQTLLIWTAKKDQECKYHQDDTKKLDKLINGNGKPGLMERVDIIEKDFIRDESEEKQRNKYVDWIKPFVLPILVAIVTCIFVNVIQHPELMWGSVKIDKQTQQTQVDKK